MKDLKPLTFEQLPEAVNQLLQEVYAIKNHLLNSSASNTIQANPKPDNELLTVSNVCNMLDMKKSGVYNLIYQNKIPHFKRGGRVYFDANEIDQWVRSDRRKTLKELQEEANIELKK